MSFELWVSLLSLLGLHLLILKLLLFGYLPPTGKRLAMILTAIHVILLGLYSFSISQASYWGWYLNYKYSEYNPAATFTTIQYLLTGMTIAAIALLRVGKFWHRLYWLALAIIFIFLALDEYFVIHESISGWQSIYILAGITIAAVSLLVWIPQQHAIRFYLMFFGGMAIAAVGGVGVEIFVARGCLGLLAQDSCSNLPIFEEVLENLGILTTFLSILAYAHKSITVASWSLFRKALVATGLTGAITLLGNPWIVPNLEARLIARPVSIGYFDGNFSVIGYRISPANVSPGDVVRVNIYWKADDPVDGDYGFSSQLIHPTETIPMSQANKFMRSPSVSEAFPGTIYRTELKLDVPRDIPTNVSYWLTLTTWQDKRPEFAMQPIDHADRQLLTQDMALLQSLPVIGQDQTIPTDYIAHYDFQSGFSLTGYNVVQADDRNSDLTLQFSWETRQDIDREFIQFLHVFDANGEFLFGIDHPPFEGTFPTSDWPGGLTLVSDWKVTLPDDLPAGEYRLLTGLYEATTIQREPVTDDSGQLVVDNLIDLGMFNLSTH